MIVRDEEQALLRCLQAVESYCDTYIIVDTGSSDGTMLLIQEWLKTHRGSLYQSEWRGFAHNRSELLGLAKGKADYLMMLDADMVLHHEGPFPELTADVYMGRIMGSLDYALPMLVRGDRFWEYRGVAHSHLASDLPYTEEVLPTLFVEDHSHTGVEKLLRDLEALSAEHARNPLDSRTCFYLAQTYYDLDRFDEAIALYRMRANMDGFGEETFYARYRLGELLCEHVSFSEGARELLAAWEMRPSRVEPLRALAGVANNVADKFPYPTDKLFVHRNAYASGPPSGLTPKDVSAVLVTRGNVDMAPILETLPYDDIVVWDNSKRPHDLRTFGRYCALSEVKHEIVYFQDDDVLFVDHQRLLDLYEPGVVIANMDPPWIKACGYQDMVMVGAGAVLDRSLPGPIFHEYLAHYGFDDEFLYESDFVFGTMCKGKQIDLGYGVREFADAPDRLYRQPWQAEAKQRTRERARALLA